MFASMYFLIFEKKTFLHEAVVVVNNQPTTHAYHHNFFEPEDQLGIPGCLAPLFAKVKGEEWC